MLLHHAQCHVTVPPPACKPLLVGDNGGADWQHKWVAITNNNAKRGRTTNSMNREGQQLTTQSQRNDTKGRGQLCSRLQTGGDRNVWQSKWGDANTGRGEMNRRELRGQHYNSIPTLLQTQDGGTMFLFFFFSVMFCSLHAKWPLAAVSTCSQGAL